MSEQIVKRSWRQDINKEQWHVLFAGCLGWGLDAFDQVIYSFTIVSLMSEWGITTAETGLAATAMMISSAVGGIFFGWLSDQIGRMKVLTITVLIYALFTGLCGFTQNIEQMIAARFIVGLGLGGEWSAGATLISESWPAEHRGKGLGIMQGGYAVGGMLACAIAGPIIQNFGWRMIFFIGVLPAFLVIYIRKAVPESRVWIEMKEKQRQGLVEKKEKVKIGVQYIPKIILGMFFVSFIMCASWPLGTWMPTFLATPLDAGGAGQSISNSSILIFSMYFGSMAGYILFGFTSDRIGRKKTFVIWMILGALFTVGQVYAAFISITAYVVLGLGVGIFGTGMYAGFGPILSELFPTRIRGTAAGIAYNGSRGIAGVFVSVVGLLMVSHPMQKVLMTLPIIYLGALICIMFFKETKGKVFEE